jgi:glycosyltransferase involved in cell wall biosynthesis
MPETILRKVKRSKNSIITFISHPKLFSLMSEKTLRILMGKEFYFKTANAISEKTSDLILITSGYPYGKAIETFLEQEIQFLSDIYGRIYIYAININETEQRNIPKNVFPQKIITNYSALLKASIIVGLLFNVNLYKELYNIIFLYKQRITYNKLFILFNHYINGYYIYSTIKKSILQNRLNSKEVTIYSYWLAETAVAAALLKKYFPKSLTISRAHRYDLYFEVHDDKYLPFRKYIYNTLDKIIFISEHGLEYFTNLLKIKKSKNLILSKLGISNNFSHRIFNLTRPLKIASCSFVTYNKRVDMIAKTLSDTDMEIEWVHIGNGWNNPDYKPIINKIELLLKDKQNITYKIAGQLSNSEIFDYYHQKPFDLFINLSKSEGLPVSIMEAMSFGIPVIATAVGGTPEIVKHGYNGLLLNADSTSKEIVNAIKYFYEMDEEVYRTFCSNAYRTWFENFNAENNYKDFIEKILKEEK